MRAGQRSREVDIVCAATVSDDGRGRPSYFPRRPPFKESIHMRLPCASCHPPNRVPAAYNAADARPARR